MKIKSSPMSFRMNQREKIVLEQYCHDNDLHVAQAVRVAVREFLDNRVNNTANTREYAL